MAAQEAVWYTESLGAVDALLLQATMAGVLCTVLAAAALVAGTTNLTLTQAQREVHLTPSQMVEVALLGPLIV